jgi:AcrR family transcriptional regulator
MSEPDRVRGPKFRRRAEARPDEVLDAAQALFMERGFAATRVEDIASRAGLSKGSVYLYFPSKEALLEGLVRRAIVPIADTALATIRDFEGDPRMLLGMVLRMLGARLSDPKVLVLPKLILRELAAFPELAQMYRRVVLDHVIPALEALIRRGIEQGHLRPVDPSLAVRSVIGPLVLHVALAEVFGIAPADGLHLDRLIDNHLTILLDGLSAPQGAGSWSAS